MKTVYRGSWPPPKYEHGDEIKYGNLTGVVHHRRHDGRSWEYGLLVHGLPYIVWIR